MKTYELIACFAALTSAIAACQSQPTTVIVPARHDRGTPKADSPASKAVPPGSAANVRQSELVKVYGMNRYVDPSDPAILHERHAIYRIEQKPEWVTRSPRSQGEILLGPVLGLRKAEYAPEPLPGETARDLVETHRGLEEANKGVQAVRENQEKLAGSVESLARRTAEAQQKLTGVLSVLNERLKRLEGDSGIATELPPESREIQHGGSNTAASGAD
jgi:hypothetical protein